MRKIFTAPQGVEVAGSAAKAMIQNLASREIDAFAEKHGLANISLHDWVPLQSLCDLFNEFYDSAPANAEQAFVAMGMRVAEQSEFPPEMIAELTLPVMLMGWDDHYKANHRGGDLPPVRTKQISDTEYELHMLGEAHPYPYNMTYGMIFSFGKMLLPTGTHCNVSYDEKRSPYGTWENGVVIKVSW